MVRMHNCSLGFRARNKLYLDALTEFTVSCDCGSQEKFLRTAEIVDTLIGGISDPGVW